MGNLRRIPDGMDFSDKDFASEKDFGFSGSAEGYDEHPVAPPFAGSKPTDNGAHPPGYAEGGEIGGSAHGFAHGGHPHGHHVIRVEHHPHTGAVVHHHAHGGHSIHHADGHVTHHGADGQAVHMSHGGQHPGEGTHVEKLMAGKHAEPDGDEHMARGGMTTRIPHSMRPKAAGMHSPINTPPRNPQRSPSPRNQMPGGQMPYGVEPSAEPDDAGSEQGIPQLRKGGHMKKSRGGEC